MLSSQEHTPMMRQFRAIKAKHPDKILFYRMGDFYEMFGEDAVTASSVLNISLTTRNKSKANAIQLCGVPYHAYETYLNKLTQAGYKVAICEQVSDPKVTKGLLERKVVRVVTPGTTLSSQLINPEDNNYLASVYLSIAKKKIGLSFVDLSTGEFELCEFDTKDLTKFRQFVFQLNPKEILLAQSRSPQESQFFDTLTHQLSVLLQAEKSQLFNFLEHLYFDHKHAKSELNSHFKVHNLSGFGVEHLYFGICAAGALMSYLNDTQMCELTQLTKLKESRLINTMILDENTLINLEVFQSSSGNAKHTLFGVLNNTQTPMGARLLRTWLKRPLLNESAILKRYDAISELINNFILCTELRSHLKQIKDISRIAVRIAMPVASINDLVSLRESLGPVVELPNHLKHFTSPLLMEASQKFDNLEDVLALLKTTLKEEPATKLSAGGYIADGVDAKLDEYRALSANSKEILNQLAKSEREKTKIASLKINYNKVFGYYIEINKAHQTNVPDTYIRKQTLANHERYINEELKELEEKILNAQEHIEEIELRIFKKLKNEVSETTGRIQKTALNIALIDTLASLAFSAENNRYIRPTIQESIGQKCLNFTGTRHPVIEQIDLSENFIPNDIALDEKTNQIMLITGPNMAGKSTYMRQIALNVMMAQCGSFVPAMSAKFSIVDRIYTRVGASDNLSGGLSTFMVEMSEAAAILNHATANSLIVLDEIGRGTSTYDGISIAWAILEFIHNLGALTLCATHYHELTDLELPKLNNFKMLVEEEGDEIVFLRKIAEGEADKSYGIHVAKLAGLPKSVVNRSMELIKSLDKNSENTSKLVPPPPPPEAGQQMSFFAGEDQRIEEIKKLKLDNMTPLEALIFLSEFSEKLK